MYIVVGLGNPGRKYEHTRHNVGFDVLEVLSQKYDIPIRKLRCKAAVGEGTIRGERVVLAQPQTFMNLSGESVVELMNWYKAEPEHLIVVYDDVDLPEGRLRFRPSGSAGTHNGMRNIIYLLGKENFPRVRVGIGRPAEGWDMKDWVLATYRTPELLTRDWYVDVDVSKYAAYFVVALNHDMSVSSIIDPLKKIEALLAKRA